MKTSAMRDCTGFFVSGFDTSSVIHSLFIVFSFDRIVEKFGILYKIPKYLHFISIQLLIMIKYQVNNLNIQKHMYF